MKRLLVVGVGALLLLLALGGALLVFLAATEGGTRFLAAQAERFLPLRLSDVQGALLREIRVGELTYELEDRTLTIERLAVAVQLQPLLFDNRLIVDAASAEAVRLSEPDTPAEPGPLPPLALPFMPLEIDVVRAEVAELDIAGLFPMRVAASAAWLRDGVTVRSLEMTSTVVDVVLEGRLGTGTNPPLSARASWALPDTEWAGQGSLEGRVDALHVQHTLRGLVAAEAEGTASLANLAEPAVDVQVAVDDLTFAETHLRELGGRLSGTLSNLTAYVDGRVQTPGLEPFAVAVQAYGPVTGPLTVRTVTADALGGRQEAQGSVAWSEGVVVRLGGTIQDVSLAAIRPELDGRASAEFRFGYEDERLGLALENLRGTLNQRPVTGALDVAQVAQGWVVDPLQLQVGDNRLSGSARIEGDRIELDADVDAPRLEALALGVSGDVQGRVRASGRWPDFEGSASLTSARLQGLEVELDGAAVQASMSSGVLTGEVSAARVRRQQLDVEAVRLALRGPLEDLDWRLAWTSGDGEGTLRRRDGAVTLGLATLRLSAIDQDWRLQAPTALTWQEGRIGAQPMCMAGGDAAACMERFVFEAGRIETAGELTRAPVAMLQPFLPLALGSDGYLEGRWTLAGEPADLRGELDLAARRLAVVPLDGEDTVELPDLEASGTLNEGVLDLRLAARSEAFEVTGTGRLTPVEPAGALSGRIDIAVSDLSPLKVFDQRIEQVSGRLTGYLDLSGTASAPRAEGRFQLSDGRLELNGPDVVLTAIDVRARLDDNGSFDVTGQARQKDRELRLTASGSGLFGEALTAQAALQGERLRFTHPDWEISVSPDLTFAYADGRGRLRGQVVVPKAEVRLNALPGSVPSPSEDVVVVGRDGASNGSSNRIRVDVDVVLGEDVALKALGITAELEGSLRARLDAQGRTTLRGTLDVTGGVLSAQGQTLSIESGTVVYNGPVTRPYIDLRAVRVIEDVTPTVTVGLHIRGDADNLTSSVFSEPAMSETRALSFLVLGRDIDQETADSDSNQLMAAAINLGLSRSKGITADLMRMTGLDELSAMAETQNSFAIVAGKRVTDDLYVRYTYNTLSAVGAFLVRYELTDRWQLEAQSGEQSAMDLMYSVEK